MPEKKVYFDRITHANCLSYMSSWIQTNFQDGFAPIAEHLIKFHDFTLLILTLILRFVSFIILFIVQKTYINKLLSAHHTLEFIWTTLPIFVLISIAIPSLTLLFIIEDSSEAYIRTKAIGYQWYWRYETFRFNKPEILFDSYIVPTSAGTLDLFRLLDTTNYLLAPVNIPTRVLVTSGDVLHSWTVPSLGVKVDACPGRLNEVILLPSRTGTYFGQCSEICGRNHRFMPIEVKVAHPQWWAAAI